MTTDELPNHPLYQLFLCVYVCRIARRDHALIRRRGRVRVRSLLRLPKISLIHQDDRDQSHGKNGNLSLSSVQLVWLIVIKDATFGFFP